MGTKVKKCWKRWKWGMIPRNAKYRKMQDGLGSQMMQLNSLKLQQSMEEFRHRNSKTTFHEITEYNGFKGVRITGVSDPRGGGGE